MKRVLALALVGAALLLGGCDRPAASAHPAGGQPAAGAPRSPAAGAPRSPAAGATRTPADAPSAASDTSDVGSLLSDVDKQLSSDDQPPADQD